MILRKGVNIPQRARNPRRAVTNADFMLDLIVVGGGVMGMMTCLFASRFTPKILLIERDEIGHPEAASSGKTRSIRNDYLDPFYARLAFEARTLWEQLDARAEEKLLLTCGVLNVADRAITPDLTKTYATQAYENLVDLGIETRRYERDELAKAYPQFSADLGCLDVEAGMMVLPNVRKFCLGELARRGVKVLQRCRVESIQSGSPVRVKTSEGSFEAASLVVTAGMWTNEALHSLDRRIEFPLTIDKPVWRYFKAPDEALYSSPRMPVFAYLDVGIYGHPLVSGLTPGVKVGFYHPPDLRAQKAEHAINCPEDFIQRCMPGFTEITPVEADFTERCSYDLVGDDNFILGPLPDCDNVYIGAGWRGTGYKFAPLIGKILSQLALQEGTIYDIRQFSPARFALAGGKAAH